MNEHVMLNYIDKVHGTLFETGRRLNRVMVVEVVASILLAGIAAGGVAVDRSFALLGARIQVPGPAPLLVTTAAVSLLLIHFLALAQHERDLADIILRLYRQLDLNDISLGDREANPLEYPNLFTTAFASRVLGASSLGRFLEIVSALLAFLLTYLLPLCAQAYAAVSTIREIGKVLSGLVIACLVFSVLYVAIDIHRVIAYVRESDQQ